MVFGAFGAAEGARPAAEGAEKSRKLKIDRPPALPTPRTAAVPPRKVHTLAEQLAADREYELGLPHEKLTDELTVDEAEANFVHIRDNWSRLAPGPGS